MEDSITFNTVKEYPDMIKIIIYREPIRSPGGRKRAQRRKNAKPTESSLRRTRGLLTDLCLCNHFELFCTFTFDPKRYNSRKVLFCRQYMNNWLHNMKARYSPNLEYLVVPELHKSGAIHFHALFKNYEGQLKDSRHCKNGRRIYNLPNWHFGFSTAVKIDNQEAVSRYIRKYITKDMLTLYDKKRYFCSQGLVRPIKHQNVPLQWLADIKNEHNITKDAEYYTITKSDLPCSLEELKACPYAGNFLL